MKQNGRWPVALLLALTGCGHSAPTGFPATPLFVGIAGESYLEGTRLLQGRLDAQFPRGSAEHNLAQYLAHQGLSVERKGRPSGPVSGLATFKTVGAICGSEVLVDWAADSKGKIESINALFSDTGCP